MKAFTMRPLADALSQVSLKTNHFARVAQPQETKKLKPSVSLNLGEHTVGHVIYLAECTCLIDERCYLSWMNPMCVATCYPDTLSK